MQLPPDSIRSEKGVSWKKGLFRIRPLSRELREILEILENLQTLEKIGESDHFLEILENLESLEILEILEINDPFFWLRTTWCRF